MVNLFALPLGVDFAQAFADGLLARYGQGQPQDLARVTIHANSQRMRRRIAEALRARGVVLLPQMHLVSDLADHLILADLPPQAPALRRRLQLNQLIRALIQREPDLAPISAVQELTESLYSLMEEMDSEGVEPAVLGRLDISSHSAHWDRSLKFLQILVPFFATSAARGSGARSRIAALRLAELWAAHPPAHPVIVAGSTASRGAISVFMEAVARLPNGAVVLPGLDGDTPGPVWQALDDAATGEDHPQFRFRRLMERLSIGPGDILPWTQAAPVDPARNRVLSLALRPAPVTDQWLTEGAALTDLPAAMGRVTLVEAASPREEALALALILRDAAERGETAALVTPDRLLARRVTAALDRWGLRPDDSAGRPLILSAPGRFLRHVADLMCDRLTAARLLVLLKHPLTMTGDGRGPHLLWTRELELRLRRHGPVFPTGADLRLFGAKRGEEAARWAGCLADLLDRVGDGQPDAHALRPLSDWVALHRDLAEGLAAGLAAKGSGALWLERPGEACLKVMEALAAEAAYGGEISALDYRDLVAALLAQEPVQDSAPVHAGIEILGAREARECGADLVILAGLTEGSWPALPGPDPWLNRTMRMQAGLLLPERQIGLSAHDFQQAAAAPHVVLSRARRSDDAETVAARWLNRLTNLVQGLAHAGGEAALKEMRARGARWLELAGRLDQPEPADQTDPGLQPARRPKPVPPADARPDRLSLTEIETLIRDPYAIYAKRVLGLRALNPLNAEPDFGDRGTVFHRILELFVTERPEGESLGDAKARLIQTARRVLWADLPFPTHRLLWLERFQAAADGLLAEDAAAGTTEAVEREGALVEPQSGVTLTGRLDRADRLPDGRLLLIDYKSGHVPTKAEQGKFAKQLLATAALVERGAFGLNEPREVAQIRYIGVSAKAEVVQTEITDELRAEVWNGLVKLLTRYRQGGLGFTARTAVKFSKQAGDYDLLSRFGEWDMSDDPVAVTVGDHGGKGDA